MKQKQTKLNWNSWYECHLSGITIFDQWNPIKQYTSVAHWPMRSSFSNAEFYEWVCSLWCDLKNETTDTLAFFPSKLSKTYLSMRLNVWFLSPKTHWDGYQRNTVEKRGDTLPRRTTRKNLFSSKTVMFDAFGKIY